MKILFVAPRFHTNQYEIVKELLSRGHQVYFHVSLIGGTEDHSLIVPERHDPCAFSILIIKLLGEGGVNSPRSFPSPMKYYKKLMELSPDVLVVRSFGRYFSLLAAFCARMLGIKIVFYEQDVLFKKVSFSRAILTRALLFFLNAAKFSPLASRGDLNNNKLPKYQYFVPFAVPLSNGVRLPSETIRILMVGKFQNRKNHILLLKALELISDPKKFSLTIVGEVSNCDHEDLLREVKKYINNLKIFRNVEIKINVPYGDMNALYFSHDIFVLPATNEPASVSVLEAMAAGMPVICSDSCGTKYYVDDGNTGYVFKSDSEFDLSDKLYRLISDRDNVFRISNNCFDFSRNNLSGEEFYRCFKQMIFDRWGKRL